MELKIGDLIKRVYTGEICEILEVIESPFGKLYRIWDNDRIYIVNGKHLNNKEYYTTKKVVNNGTKNKIH